MLNPLINPHTRAEEELIPAPEGSEDLMSQEKLFKSEKKIKIIKNSKTVGAGFSRNKGIENANGEFIAFIDADDTWKKYKLEKQINFMKKNSLDISFI